STQSYTFTVTVTDDGGQLVAAVTGATTGLNFTNKYEPLVTIEDVSVIGLKSTDIDGYVIAVDEFSFILHKQDIDGRDWDDPEDAKTELGDATGALIQFSKLGFTHVGEYRFVVTEAVGSHAYWQYDNTTHTFIVTVGDIAGQLVITDITGSEGVSVEPAYNGYTISFAFDNAHTNYTVNYDTNGGEPATIDSLTDVNWFQSNLLSAYDPIREGYTFTGWNVSAGGNGTGVTSDDTYGDLADDDETMSITLQAQWTANDDVVVTYYRNWNADDSASYDDEDLTFDTNYTVLGLADVGFGFLLYHTFTGWATSADGQVVYEPGDSIDPLQYGNELYAIWVLVADPAEFEKTADEAGYEPGEGGGIIVSAAGDNSTVTFKITYLLPDAVGLNTWTSIRFADHYDSTQLRLIGVTEAFGNGADTDITPSPGSGAPGEFSVSYNAADLTSHAGKLLTLTLVFEVKAGVSGAIRNYASYFITPKGGVEPDEPGGDDDEEIYEFFPVESFTKTYGEPFIGVGDDIDFTVSFKLPDDIKGYAGLLLVDYLPATLDYKSSSVYIDDIAAPSINPTNASGRVSIYLSGAIFAGLEGGNVVELHITATVNDTWESGDITNAAYIYYQLKKGVEPDPDTDEWDEETSVTVPNREFTVTYFKNSVLATGSVPVDDNSPYIRDARVTILGSGSLALTGYNFIGWAYEQDATTPDFALDGTAFDPAWFEIDSNVELYAVWQARSDILVTFNANGGTAAVPGSKYVTYDAAYGTLATTSRTGHTFLGWFTSPTGGTRVTSDTIVTNANDHTLYAQWTAIPYTVNVVNSYATTTGAGTYYIGNTVTVYAGTRAGYTFSGWTVNAGGVTLANRFAATTSFTMPAANVTVTANWTAIAAPPIVTPPTVTYTVTFVDWDGTVLSTQTVAPGADATAPTAPTREGYIFTGWDIAFTNVQSDLTVTALYEAEPEEETFTVIFLDNDDNVISEQTVPRGGNAVEPEIPVLEGQEFIGWDTDFTNVQSDLTVRPLYEDPVPLIGGAAWALINLLCAIAGILVAIAVIIRMIVAKRKEEDEETGEIEQTKRRTIWIVLTVILAIVGIVFFILTEDMRNPMIMVDRWTIFNVIFLVLGIVTALLSFKSETTEEQEQTPAAA
ncbi:MAG: InlB B-repeat-containing protein, partial [Coriobacteriia bacterium]|nr:InlB B-repeat-containing protein [Coriobacteriia bacterium]